MTNVQVHIIWHKNIFQKKGKKRKTLKERTSSLLYKLLIFTNKNQASPKRDMQYML
jgi:hypothetical protein